MIAAIVIGSILLVLLAVVLLTRVRVIVDTEADNYSLSWGRVVKGAVHLRGDTEVAMLRVAFWRWQWTVEDILKALATRPTSKRHKKTHTGRKDRRGGPGFRPRHILRILRSFRVRRFYIDLDTDDYTLNALLYPAFFALDKTPATWRINFTGHSVLQLDIDNRPLNILRSLM